MNIIKKIIKEHNEDKAHPNWKETCELCVDIAIKQAKKEVFDDLLKRQKRELIIGVAYRDVILLNHKEFEELKQRHLSTFSEKEKAT